MRLTNIVIVLVALAEFSPSLALTTRHSPPPRPPCRSVPNTQQEEQQERHEITRATTSRRSFIDGAAIAGTAIFTTTTLVRPVLSAHAKYGASSTMALPNYIDYLIEKNNQGLDTGDRLYQGADPAVLLQRLKLANDRLDEVAVLAADRKWSQVQGVVTGPLGTLGQTLNTLVQAQPKNKSLASAAKQVKAAVIGIGQAAASKNAEQCTQCAAQAQQELQTLVQLAFDQSS